MQLTEYADPQSFLHASNAFLMREEAANNLLLSSALTLARSTAGRLPGLAYFTVQAGGEMNAAAMNVADRRLLLSPTDAASARFLGSELGRRKQKVRAILGPVETAEACCLSFLEAGGSGDFSTKQEIMQLLLRPADLRSNQAPEGLWRLAREKDQRLVYAWTRRFVEECRHDETPGESGDLVHRYIANRQLFIWEDGDGPVAMAGFSGLTPNGARINMVYTDPRARGRRYAGALVAAVTRKLLAPGEKKFCFLFVDSANQAAISVYNRLGFRRLGAFSDLR